MMHADNKKMLSLAGGIVVGIMLAATGLAQEAAAAPAATVSPEMFTVNNVWMMVSAFLVFTMHLGFASLESGLTRAKNTVNILFKNVAIVSIGILIYALVGFNLMYPGEVGSGFLVLPALGIGTDAAGLTSAYNAGYTYWTDFLFQGMFAATAATIVSGAVAERIKLGTFLILMTVYVGVCYPIVGLWHWGGGWLSGDGLWMVNKFGVGFHDFAGSTIVHTVGGWAALMAAYILGPRAGKYVEGQSRAIMGHSMPLAAIGVFLLWLGWFGFNGGSVLSADAGAVSFVLVTTNLAAAAGVIGAMLTSWIIQKKPDLSMILNGALAGLVGITAGADVVSVGEAVVIGLVAGVLVVGAVLLIDQVLKIDDPVGAVSVHLVCGIWGALAAGIFGTGCKVLPQVIGVLAVGAFCAASAGVLFGVAKALKALRVSEEEEHRGLDIGEHDMEAYSGFQIFTSQ